MCVSTTCVIIVQTKGQSNPIPLNNLFRFLSAHSPKRLRIRTSYLSQLPWSTIFTKWYFTKLRCSKENKNIFHFNLKLLRPKIGELITRLKPFIKPGFKLHCLVFNQIGLIKFKYYFRFRFIFRGACQINFISQIRCFCIVLK